jgi:hypothetical protein
MKKTKFMLATLLLLPSLVLASSSLEGNMTGGYIKPSTGQGGSGGSGKNACAYYIGFTQSSYMTTGLRVTFYDTNGNQVGNTVDVWYWLSKFDYWNKNFVKQDNGTLVNSLGFKVGQTTFTKFTPYISKYEYVNGIRDLIVMKEGNTYTYYYDDASRYFGEAKGDYSKSPLVYTNKADRSYLKEYFTTPSVMERYMKLAEVDKSIDVTLGNYKVTLEPLVSLSRMSGSKCSVSYVGRYTLTDIGKLWASGKIRIENINLRCNLPKYLYLEKDNEIGSYVFKAPTKTSCATSETVGDWFSNLGIGISIINGSEVCYPNCKSAKKYKIVYHTINLANPFVKTDDGTNRVLSDSSNWYQKESTIDTSIYSKEPMLTVTLTPSDITKIREYNKDGLRNYNCAKFKENFSNIFSNQNFC